MDNSANLWRCLAQAMALSYNKLCSGYRKVDCFDFLTMVYASERLLSYFAFWESIRTVSSCHLFPTLLDWFMGRLGKAT